MATPPTDLCDVPEAFFDQAAWQAFIMHHGDRPKAMVALGEKVDGWITYAREELATSDSAAGNDARRQLRSTAMRDALVASFRDRLRSGTLQAHAYSPPYIERVIVPVGLWAYLELDFVGNRATGNGYDFLAVTVAEPESPEKTLQADCVVWLLERPKATKKVSLHDARERFGAALTTRIFNAAFTEAFGKTVGRPRNNP